MKKKTTKRVARVATQTKKKKKKQRKSFEVGGFQINPGETRTVQINVAKLYDFTDMMIPVHVIRGKADGPRLFLSAAIHGDEILGVEIIRRILRKPSLQRIKGTLIAVPIVNVFGFNSRSRYLPDRKDLNRSFPGSPTGSLAARLAHIFMKEIVKKCTHGIDFHTAALHRSNLPQIRANLKDPITRKLSKVFGCPVALNSELRDGSLREAARKRDMPMLLFEGGEALRYSEWAIKSGVSGTIAVMREIGMLPKLKNPKPFQPVYFARHSFWIRAPHSGSLRFNKKLGDRVEAGECLAWIEDVLGSQVFPVPSPEEGIVIGRPEMPLVNKGDAAFHIATFRNSGRVASYISDLDAEI